MNYIFQKPHNVDRKVTEFSSVIRQALDSTRAITVGQNSLQELTFLPLAKDQMLNSFNAVVRQYSPIQLPRLRLSVSFWR